MNQVQDFSETLFFQAMLEGPNGICMTDADGKILEVNEAFLKLYRYQRDEVIGENPRILKSGRHAPQVYVDMWQQLVDPACGRWNGELINRDKEGGIVIVNLSIQAVRSPDRTLQGFIANAFDITRWKRQEQSLIKHNEQLSATNQLKSEMLAITSHDLRAPINAIISRVNLLKSTCEVMPTSKIVTHLDGIASAGNKLGEMISEQLDLAKIEAGKVGIESERVSLDSLLRSVSEINQFSADTRQIRIQYHTAEQMHPLYADRMKLEQVFNNLLSNAVKFAPENSAIEVSCRLEKDRCRVSISDEGPGIPATDLEQIFDRFYQVRKERVSIRNHGSGLGLSIVKKFVELHGGRVSVSNREPSGCNFVVELPVPGSPRSGKDLAAMIVDPDGTIYASLEKRLKSAGVSVFVCKTERIFQRTLAYAYPELIFFPDGELPAEIRDTLESLAGAENPGSPFLIRIVDNMAVMKKYSNEQIMSVQLTDDNIRELLGGVIRQMTEESGEGI